MDKLKVAFKTLIDEATLKTIKSLEKTKVCVGFKYEESDEGISVADLARIQHYGAFGPGNHMIPARPFMDFAIGDKVKIRGYETHTKKLRDRVIRALKENMVGNADVSTARQAMKGIGEAVKANLQETIDSGVPPANSPDTLKRKRSRSTTTLIDYGVMRRAIKVWTE